VPRSQAAVASLLPQPRNSGAVVLPGLAVSPTTVPGTLPHCVQTVTAQRAACPGRLLACAATTWMHKLGAVTVTAVKTAR
jgi:hypothetical protein